MFERKFKLRQVIKDFPNLKTLTSPPQEHFGVPWKLKIEHRDAHLALFLHCNKTSDAQNPWSITVDYEMFLITMSGKKKANSGCHTFEKKIGSGWSTSFLWDKVISKHMVDNTVIVECEVTVKKSSGLEKKRSISFEEPKEHLTDVVLKVGDKKFNVLKGRLAADSPYFYVLFFGKFAEASQAEIVLKDVDPEDFENLLHAMHGDWNLTPDNIEGFMKLADRFQVDRVGERCEEFLMLSKEVDMKQKLRMAESYKMENLKNHCIGSINTSSDLKACLPLNLAELSHGTLAALLEKSVFQQN